MMLYDTIRNEGAMQKTASIVGALIGGGTNEGNWAAGTIGGGIGGRLAPNLALELYKAVDMGNAPGPLRALAGLSLLGLPISGGYLGGKLGAKVDHYLGSPVTTAVNKLLGRN